jgi:hypothetical protein
MSTGWLDIAARSSEATAGPGFFTERHGFKSYVGPYDRHARTNVEQVDGVYDNKIALGW